jgi:hypothetical protein
MATLRVMVRPSRDRWDRERYNDRGALYDAALDMGSTWLPLCEAVLDPEHDAARVLLKSGYHGPFETVDDRGMVRMRFAGIEAAAKRRVYDDPKRGLIDRRWTPHPHAPGGPPLSEKDLAGLGD